MRREVRKLPPTPFTFPTFSVFHFIYFFIDFYFQCILDKRYGNLDWRIKAGYEKRSGEIWGEKITSSRWIAGRRVTYESHVALPFFVWSSKRVRRGLGRSRTWVPIFVAIEHIDSSVFGLELSVPSRYRFETGAYTGFRGGPLLRGIPHRFARSL